MAVLAEMLKAWPCTRELKDERPLTTHCAFRKGSCSSWESLLSLALEYAMAVLAEMLKAWPCTRELKDERPLITYCAFRKGGCSS